MKKESRMKLVAVEWEDSRQPTSAWQWLDELEQPKPIACLSVGFLAKQDKTTIALAPNLADIRDDGRRQASGVIEIPRRCIVSITRLPIPKGRGLRHVLR